MTKPDKAETPGSFPRPTLRGVKGKHTMRTVVFTSDKHSWLLRGFFHQWDKYGKGLPVDEVAGFTNPGGLPYGVGFYSMGKMDNYPINKWSDAVIKYLKQVPDDLVTILLEDYWLMRPINRDAVDSALDYMSCHPDVVRFDLAADRMFNNEAEYIEPFEGIDICSAKGAYSLSFQASIYRREMLLDLMRPGETPWEAELKDSDRLNKTDLRVVGTYNWPVAYSIVVNKGKLDMEGRWMYPARTLTDGDWQELEAAGCLRREVAA